MPSRRISVRIGRFTFCPILRGWHLGAPIAIVGELHLSGHRIMWSLSSSRSLHNGHLAERVLSSLCTRWLDGRISCTSLVRWALWSKHRWRACPWAIQSILSGVNFDQPYLFTHVFHQCWGWISVSDLWLVFGVDSAAREMKLCAFSSIIMADSYAIKIFLPGALYAYRGA